jgi:hypothetical protein
LRLRAVALVVIASAAAGLLLASTHTWGLGVSYDSVVYVQASNSLSSIPLPQGQDAGGKALYWWAPAYPLALRAVGGSYSSARFLNALLLFLGAVLVGAIAWRTIDSGAGLVAAALYAAWPAVFASHLSLLAEPLFLVLATATLGLSALRHPAWAGAAAAAATLTRYAGLPLILTGAILFRGRDRWKFLAASVPPYLIWLLRNEIVAGETTGRQLRWHPPDWGFVENGLRGAFHLFVTNGYLPSIDLPLVHASLLVELCAGAALVIAVLRADRGHIPTIVRIGAVYAGLYCAFLAVTVLLFDAVTPLDQRLLLPLIPSLVFAVAWLTKQTPLAAVVVIVLFGLVTVQQARLFSNYGQDYSGRIWGELSFDSLALPAGDLHSNWPAAVAYFTGRSPQRMPRPSDAHTGAPNLDYEQDMKNLATAVRTGETTLVLLNERFLQLTESGTPLAETAPFKAQCHAVTSIITICGGHRTSARG